MPFVLVRGVGRPERERMRGDGRDEKGRRANIARCERRPASGDEWRLDEYSVVVVVFKTVETTGGVFARHNPLP